MKNDFDFIKEKFDNDKISAPETLNERSAADIIEGKQQKKIKFYNKKSFKAAVSLVACAALVVGCISVANFRSGRVAPSEAVENMPCFESYDDMRAMIKTIESRNGSSMISINDTFTISGEIPKGDAALDGLYASNSEENTGGEGGYTTTYTQVEGVDEADVVKNDGKYIYALSSRENVIKIYEANGMNPKLVSELKDDFTSENDDTDDDDAYIVTYEMFLKDNRLIVIYNAEYSLEKKGVQTYDGVCCTIIYDITDKSDIRLVSRFEQSGFYNSSRMIDDTLYLISTKEINNYVIHDIDSFVPRVKADGKEELVSADCIACPENPNENSILVISSIDTKTGKQNEKTKAVFGCSGKIYCNKDNLYVAVEEFSINNPKTDVLKVNIGNGISFKACAEVEGSVNDQFSMDEYNGYFRIATTSVKYNDDEEVLNTERYNNLYVLDDELKIVGTLTGFAENENIEAVKFMGDTAYVITFENTDPLFVIDLKNPEKPRILGSVEIDGYSSQLLTIGEDRVLGIGFHSDTETFETGLKLVLFDTSDKANPKVLDTYVMVDAMSNAQGSHKAIAINKEKNCYAIDYDKFTIDEDRNQTFSAGAIVFKVENDKINVTNNFSYIDDKTDDYFNFCFPLRTTFIGDILYSIDSDANVYAFSCK